mmetsp:Transcript_54429/g.80794  ORF Transcript_54429/g.80794 Transcript_54429/m.80794 type:complete len:383 (-) Transcript_54429:390-1538(-)|eukprot:CAMPEP_0195513234 /NCGR_PEP_ID=MMETSP0794_2-20130614/4935_1 /TAXON_ID=515487 /ORGANISM="Stephanopyxis turris, Strain CCMP 815" /LENGTH=382 /DNA_ID=CAMNT_0040641193 /DNA_START=121 /DNA_END=1269 /DNA_ORIENTATION=+
MSLELMNLSDIDAPDDIKPKPVLKENQEDCDMLNKIEKVDVDDELVENKDNSSVTNEEKNAKEAELEISSETNNAQEVNQEQDEIEANHAQKVDQEQDENGRSLKKRKIASVKDSILQPQPSTAETNPEATSKKAPNTAKPVARKPRKTYLNRKESMQVEWQKMLYELLLYKSEHGDCLVPSDYEKNKGLAKWIAHQRREYRAYMKGQKSSMTENRIKAMQAAGHTVWCVRDANWEKRFDELVAYKEIKGNCLVPKSYKHNQKLADWVLEQRRQNLFLTTNRSSNLTQDHVDRLNSIGFTWLCRIRSDWDSKYRELLEYKAEFGNCCVPQHYQRNKHLGKWVAKQREQYSLLMRGKHSLLTPERLDILNSVDFVWNAKRRAV